MQIQIMGRQGSYGMQEEGFVPVSGQLDPRAESRKLDEYGVNYNPWAVDGMSDVESAKMMSDFTARLTSNTGEALTEYAELRNRKYGYSYTTTPGIMAEQPQSMKEFQRLTGMGGREAFESGWQPGDLVTKRSGTGKDSMDERYSYVRPGEQRGTGLGAWEQAEARGDVDVQMAPKDLTDAEEYMLFKYEVAAMASDDAIGSGAWDESELGGLTLASKATQDAAEITQLGIDREEIGRKQRAAGKSKFKRPLGAQL